MKLFVLINLVDYILDLGIDFHEKLIAFFFSCSAYQVRFLYQIFTPLIIIFKKTFIVRMKEINPVVCNI